MTAEAFSPKWLRQRPVHLAFDDACKCGDIRTVRTLLNIQWDPDVNVLERRHLALVVACENGHLKVVRELLGLDGDRCTSYRPLNDWALLWACENGHLELVQELLQLEGDHAPGWATVIAFHTRSPSPPIASALLAWTAAHAPSLAAFAAFVGTLPDELKPAARAAFAAAQ